MLDYKSMLERYMDHVCTCEGTKFLSDLNWTNLFSPEEELELKKLGKYSTEVSKVPYVRSEVDSKALKELLLKDLTEGKISYEKTN